MPTTGHSGVDMAIILTLVVLGGLGLGAFLRSQKIIND
jgi:hypothetical protein